MSRLSKFLEENENVISGISDRIKGLAPNTFSALGKIKDDSRPPSGIVSNLASRAKQDDTGMDDMTQSLYKQLLGLMDQQANTDLANEQIGQLSSILSQQAALGGKDVAAAGFASGAAQPANIAPILQEQQKALAQRS